MTAEEIIAAHPEAAATLRTMGADAERTRIQAVHAVAPTGHDKLIATLMFDGKSSAGDAALAVLAAEQQVRTSQAAALAADAPAALALAPAATVQQPKPEQTRATLDADAKAYMAAHPGTDYVAAIKHVQHKGA